MGLFSGIGNIISDVVDGIGDVAGDVLGAAGDILNGAGDLLSGDGGEPDPAAGAASTYTPSLTNSDSSIADMATFMAGQAQQSELQSNMMNLMGLRMQMMQQGKLDADLEIKTMDTAARMQEAQYSHDEKLLELLNKHTEGLVDDGMITPDMVD